MPTKRGAHLALSLERLTALAASAASAHRPVGDAAPARRGRAVPRGREVVGSGSRSQQSRQRHVGADAQLIRGSDRPRPTSTTSSRLTRTDPLPAGHDRRRRRRRSALSLSGRGAGRGHGAAGDRRRDPERAGVGRRHATVDLGGDPPAPARADPRAPVDADLRQQPPARRAAGRRAQRARRRDARPVAPRLDRARAARRDRRPAQGRRASARSSPPRRSSSASTWARSTSSSRSRRRRRSRADCSASAAAATRSNAVSEGVIFPKFRGDLVACAAVARAMHDGAVEATRYPRNPLDVLAQQIVAMAAMDTWDVDELFATIRARGAVRRAEPRRRSTACSTCCRAAIRRTSSPSCGRASPGTASRGTISAREGAKRVAIVNGGTIPDRGLYGVFLAGAGARRGPRRRARRGDGVRDPRRRDLRARRLVVADRGDHARPRARLAGARRAGQDAVLEGRPRRPAAGVRPGHRRAGARRCCALPPAAAIERLDARARSRRARPRENLLQYLRDQMAATRRRARRVARSSSSACRDELGDWRVCVLSPLGGRIHAPWAMAVGGEDPRASAASTSRRCGATTGSWCGFRTSDAPPDVRLLLPDPDEVEALVVRQLGATALFAAQVPRERRARAAAAAPPARHARAALAAAQARGRSAGRRVALRIVPDAARDLPRVPARRLRHAGAGRHARRRSQPDASASSTVDSEQPSPFAASLLFSYVANFIYDGDAPLAERRAQALASRPGPAARAARRRRAARAARRRRASHARRARSCSGSTRAIARRAADGVHDLLLALGDLTRGGDRGAHAPPAADAAALGRRLVARPPRRCGARRAARRATSPSRTPRATATRSACRCPPGLPEALLEPVARSARRPRRCATPARTGRSPLAAFAARYALGTARGRRRARCALAGDGQLRRRRVPPGRHRARVVRSPTCCASMRRRSLAQAAARGRAGRAPVLGRLVDDLAGRRPAPARARRAARRDRAAAGRAAAGVDPRDARSFPRGSTATIPRISTPWRRPARWCGWASSRSATATDASRST